MDDDYGEYEEILYDYDDLEADNYVNCPKIESLREAFDSIIVLFNPNAIKRLNTLLKYEKDFENSQYDLGSWKQNLSNKFTK